MMIPRMDRRRFLAIGGAGAAALGVSATPQAAAVDQPLYTYDLTHLHELDLSDPQTAAEAYDELHLVACVQGIVNRDQPRLYVHFVTQNELGTIDIDEYWLSRLQVEGQLLAGREMRAVGSPSALVRTFRRWLRGSVVWDPSVPATSNVASTVAGADDLVALRFDEGPRSMYQRMSRELPPSVWLINTDGTPRFTGRGNIPDIDRASSGSAKCDVYLWAVERYLATGRSEPILAYYLDAYWLQDPQGQLQQALLTNHDYLVSQRGFLFDLQPWDDERPGDDPGQPLGTDQRTLEQILRTAYERAGAEFFPVHGFVPWAYKYTTEAPSGSKHEPVATEWRFVQVASAFNAYVDADAENLDAMANASVFRHVPLQESYPQQARPDEAALQARGYLDEDHGVVPKRYVMIYVGDYDSAAWLYQVFPYLWEDDARGSVPLNWPFNPNLSDRMPIAMEQARRTATHQDTFIAGDSGAGYIQPGMLSEPREFSGLPQGIDAWERHCRTRYRQWDLTVTGFVIDGDAPGMDLATLEAFSRFSPGGFAAQKIDPIGLVGQTPYVQMGPDLPRGSVEEGAAAMLELLEGDLDAPPVSPEFHSVRTILQSPTWHRDVVETSQDLAPGAELEVVDAHTFYELVRRSQIA